MFDIRDSADSKSIKFSKKFKSYSLAQSTEENENNHKCAEIRKVNNAKTLARRMGGMPLMRFSSLLNNK